MAKLELNNISNISGAESTAIATINNNSAAIETALENTLSRDGTTPNTMSADFDMNGNDILNADNGQFASITLNGQDLEDSINAVGEGVPLGGTTGQVLAKASNTNFDTEWTNAGAGDLLAINNLSDVDDAETSLNNIATFSVWGNLTYRTLKQRATDVAFSGDFDVDPTGANDSTAGLQELIGQDVRSEISPGTFEITDTLFTSRAPDFDGRGKIIEGQGRRKTLIRNSSTSALLFAFGDASSGVDALDTVLARMSFEGNAATVGGIHILGEGQGLTQPSRGVRTEDIRVSDVGAGPAMKLDAWRSINKGFEVEDCFRGVEIGEQVYATHFDGLYVISATNEALYIPDTVTPAVSSCIKFTNPVLQRCGASGQMVYLGGGGNLVFDAVYMEIPDNAATAAIRAGGGVRSINMGGLMLSMGSSTATVDVLDTEAQGFIVENMLVFGDVRSYAKISGTLPYTEIRSVQHPVGSASLGGDGIDDQSTRKVTFVRKAGDTGGRDLPTTIRSLLSQNALEMRDSATDEVKAFFKHGELFFGPDTTSPKLSRSGSTLNNFNGSSYGNFRTGTVTLGPDTVRWQYRDSGTPEGANTADPGSFCAVRTGTEAGLWAKASGTGATGWQKITT